jgi:hypothetical protein
MSITEGGMTRLLILELKDITKRFNEFDLLDYYTKVNEISKSLASVSERRLRELKGKDRKNERNDLFDWANKC